MGDLVKEPLRCFVTGNPVGTDTWKLGGGCQCTGCRAAARIEALEGALRPFADWDDPALPDDAPLHFKMGDLRRARAVLEDKS